MFVFLITISPQALSIPETISELEEMCRQEIENPSNEECSLLLGMQLVMWSNPSSEQGRKRYICDEELTSKGLAELFISFSNTRPEIQNSSIFDVLPEFFDEDVLCST